MEILKENVIEVELNGFAARLKPTIFLNGDNYCVLYGKNSEDGVYGYGKSVTEALIDWENNLQKIFSDDLEIKRIIAAHEPPAQVAEFLEAYRERAKHDETSYNQNRNY